MPKKEVREDTHAWVFAAKVYVVVVGVFLFAFGLDIYDAIQSIGSLYASAI